MGRPTYDSVLDFIRSAGDQDAFRRLILRAVLRAKRRQQPRACSLNAKAGVAERLNRKRNAINQAQKLRRRLMGASRPPLPIEQLVFRYGDHAVIQSLNPARKKRWKPIPSRDRGSSGLVVDIPRLSFLDDPVGAFECIRQLTEVETHALSVRVNFTFQYVEDIGPFLLLSELWPYFAPVFTGGGTMHPPVQKVIAAVGLQRSLSMHFPGLADLKDVWAMPVQKRRPSGRSRSADRYLQPQSSEMAADLLCREIDRWFLKSESGVELNAAGRQHLGQVVTEILDNAERHSSYKNKDGSWTTAAFMAKRDVDGSDCFVCHIAFLSLGDTIAESLMATAPDSLRRQLHEFADDYAASGAAQSRETLLTLAAIQDGVTRDAEAFARKSGGYGFMDFVDSVNVLGLSKHTERAVRMVIISGNSCITLKAPYVRGFSLADGSHRRLYFNSDNNPAHPPDDRFVKDLPFRLPGTVISAAFTLDPDLYRTIFNDDDPAS
jgi:hypothetical protein